MICKACMLGVGGGGDGCEQQLLYLKLMAVVVRRERQVASLFQACPEAQVRVPNKEFVTSFNTAASVNVHLYMYDQQQRQRQQRCKQRINGRGSGV
jgi:hypothetical protein